MYVFPFFNTRPSSSNFVFFTLNTDMVTAKYVLYIVQHTKVVQGPRIYTDQKQYFNHNSCLKWYRADWNSFCRIFHRSLSHERLSRRRLIAVTSDILSLSSLKTNAEYSARHYCCVGPRRTEKEKGGRKVWVHSVVCDRQNEMLFRTIFEDPRRGEVKFFLKIILEFMDYFEELYETIE